MSDTAKKTCFHIGPIRPPSEANSLLLQVTAGCTWNKCKFCDIYRGSQFRAYQVDDIKADIDAMAALRDRAMQYRRPDGGWNMRQALAEMADELHEPQRRQQRQYEDRRAEPEVAARQRCGRGIGHGGRLRRARSLAGAARFRDVQHGLARRRRPGWPLRG